MNKLTEEEKKLFEKLIKDREESAKVLEKPMLKGVKSVVVDEYSDQAHFIYELLQNADDAKATLSKFVLKKKGLYFIHNGTVPFSISDPEKEEEDKETGKLGHINSITSVGNSAKDEYTIGKFGVGFKAVFKYTDTPHIFDPRFKFKIERFFVPKLIEDKLIDDIERDESDTVFYFPFDKIDMSEKEAFNDILDKMKSLKYPTLLLSLLDRVSWKTEEEEEGGYYKKPREKETKNGTAIQLIDIFNKVNNKENINSLWLFTKQHTKYNYSVGFFLEKDKLKIRPVNIKAFCFFPTKEKTNLSFMIHAPFLLTHSRETIRAKDNWNIDLINKLSELAAESMGFLKEKKLLDGKMFDIIPYRESDFIEDKDSISFKPFYNAIKNKLMNETLLPARSEYTDSKHAYWAEYGNLFDLYSDENISDLVGKSNTKLVFPSINESSIRENKDLIKYINDITSGCLRSEALLKLLNDKFIQKQIVHNFNWLHNLYNYLLNSPSYQIIVKYKPIFADSNKCPVPAFNSNNELILFIPADERSEYPTLHRDLLKNETSRKFFENFKIKEPDLFSEINIKILPQYSDKNANVDTIAHFKKFFSYFNLCHNDKVNDYIYKIKNIDFIQCESRQKGKTKRGIASNIYFPDDDLINYFKTKPDTWFLDFDFYCNILNNEENKKVKDFFSKIGVKSFPDIYKKEIDFSAIKDRLTRSNLTYYITRNVYEKVLDGCEELINNISICKEKSDSILLWKELIAIINGTSFSNIKGLEKGVRECAYGWSSSYISYSDYFYTTDYLRLTKDKWLYNKDGIFVSSDEVTVDTLSEDYDKTSDAAKSLISFLHIKDNSREEDLASQLGISVNTYKYIEEHPEEIEKYIKEKEARNRRPVFPEGKVNSPEKRADAMAEQYADSDEKTYEDCRRRVRVSKPGPGGKKTYLEYQYTNSDNQMVCQICEKEMPFKKHTGEYYYEAVEVLSNKYLTRENIEQYLALCPECSARYNEFVLHDDKTMEELKNKLINGSKLEINLGTKTREQNEAFVKNIRFNAGHLLDLQTILKEEEK